MSKKRIFSGIKPSGDFTIGNYIGAIRQWVEEQDEYDCFYCIVDMHAITVPQDPRQLHKQTLELLAIYLAAGLDPSKVTLFIQSHVSAHAELGWILNCMSPLGWLNRMTQYKDKVAKKQEDSIGSGLLTYPTLMAADILLYQTHVVPVGDDQRQHLEFTRDLAQRFNSAFGETFILPETLTPKAGARIMGLDNPLVKMSKSETSDFHAIYLLDTPDKLKKKIMRSVTDSYGEIKFSDDDDRAGVNNLLTIYQSLTFQTREEIEAHFAGKGYGDLKKGVLEQVELCLSPLQARYNEIIGDQAYLNGVLQQGAERAREVANQTLKLARERIGFVV
jgi:tryptophanyl-tRNA synthetase